MLQISVHELKARLDQGEPVHLLDVREEPEVAICRLEGAEHIPMLPLFLGAQKTKAPQDATIVVYCHHGIRSFEAAQFLKAQGFQTVLSLTGGIDAWAREIDPSVPKY